MIVFFLAILFLVLAIFAEAMDEWSLGERSAAPLRVFPNCFAD